MVHQGAIPYRVCGVPIHPLQPDDAAATVVQAAAAGGPFEVHLCNAYTLSLVDSDPVLNAALQRANLNLADGMPVAWLGRRHGLRGPVRGPGLVGEVVDRGRVHGVRHYFLGAAPGVANLMAERLVVSFPGAVVAGTESPPWGAMTDDQVRTTAERIRESGAQLVWVGLGTPQQDHLVPRMAKAVELPVVPVGAAFDYWAGTVAEAPRWLHGTGMEWLHRFATEPRRLWRRYTIGNLRFLGAVVRSRRAP